MPEELPDPVVVGVISSPHGVRGTLRVKPSGDGRHLRVGISPVLDGERVEILNSRPTPKGFLIDLAGFSGRDEVEHLRGHELTLDRSELDAPDDGEVYVADLVGMNVVDQSGESLGIVSETYPTAAHEILVVKKPGTSDFHLPFTFEHVPEMNLEAGTITANPPEPDSEPDEA